jgi:hypothetical protein
VNGQNEGDKMANAAAKGQTRDAGPTATVLVMAAVDADQTDLATEATADRTASHQPTAAERDRSSCRITGGQVFA